MAKRSIHLVRDNGVLRPKEDTDYEVLKQLKIPFYKIEENLFSMLTQAERRLGLQFHVSNFSELEEALAQKVAAKWPHLFSITRNEITLITPKVFCEKRIDKLVSALQSWYSKHDYVLEVNYKRTSKTLKVSLLKKTR